MSIFRREGQAPSATPATVARDATGRPEARGRSTVIASGSRIAGEITGTAEVVVEGEFAGKVHVEDTVTVGAQGLVEGEIRARTVRIAGKVTGDVFAAERIEVLATGSAEGDLAAPRVVIAEGAYFKGNVSMTGGGKKAARPATGAPDPSRGAS